MTESVCDLYFPFRFYDVYLLLTDTEEVGLVGKITDLFIIGYGHCHLYFREANDAGRKDSSGGLGKLLLFVICDQQFVLGSGIIRLDDGYFLIPFLLFLSEYKIFAGDVKPPFFRCHQQSFLLD